MNEKATNMADYILPLNINGLQGRMLRMPPRKGRHSKREILFIYGHHASIERHFGVAEFLNKYGGVTIPDLPGFGGMDPFSKIGERPTLDNMADYLAAFIKLRYRNRRFIIGGYSLGVMVVTRMLQKYPDIAKKVDMVASIAGFAHKDDFRFKRHTYFIFRWGTSLFSHKLTAGFLKYFIFRGPLIRMTYRFIERFFISEQHSKIRTAADDETAKKAIEFEVHLWQCNDVRTYMEMGVTMFTLDLTGAHVDLPIYHVAVDNDRYFNNVLVEEHMRQIYKDFYMIKAKKVPTHSPSVIATAKDAAPFIPPELRKALVNSSKK